MHIVFFNRSFYPDTTATGQLLTDLSEDLVRDHGCHVTVVAGPPLAPSAAEAARGWGLVRREDYRGITILRVRGTRFDKKRFAGRATNYVSYFLSSCWASLTLGRADVVVALTDPPIIGLAGYLAALRTRAPLVMAYQDLFPEVAALLEDFKSDTVNAMLQAVNRFLVQKATRVVALGETMRQRLIENKGAPEERTLIIPNWADTAAITPGSKENPFARALGLTRTFVVMHSGNMGLSQQLESLVEAAGLLRDVPDLEVVFQGDGVKKQELLGQVAALGLTNVRFLPYAPQASLGQAFATADLFIVSLQRGLAGYIVPSKLYTILASGRPFVAAVEDTCEVAAVARRYDCGVVAEPGNARDLADKILMFHRDRELAARTGANARVAGLAFDRKVQVQRYMDVFRSIVDRPLPAGASR